MAEPREPAAHAAIRAAAADAAADAVHVEMSLPTGGAVSAATEATVAIDEELDDRKRVRLSLPRDAIHIVGECDRTDAGCGSGVDEMESGSTE